MKNVVVVTIVIVAAIVGVVFFSQANISQQDADGGANTSKQGETRPRPAETGPWPMAIVETTEYDFGRMQIGTEQEHTFTIRNDGDAPLRLMAGESTCKCTKFELTETKLEKGEESELTIQWKGKDLDPEFRHGGPIYTDDPEQKTIQFYVNGSIEKAVQLLPASNWNIGKVMPGKTGTLTGVVVSRIHDSFGIGSLDTGSPHVTAEATQMDSEQLKEYDAVCGYSVTVTVSPEMPPGLLETKLELELDCVEEPISVQLRATKDGPLKLFAEPGVVWIDSAHGLKLGTIPGRHWQRSGAGDTGGQKEYGGSPRANEG